MAAMSASSKFQSKESSKFRLDRMDSSGSNSMARSELGSWLRRSLLCNTVVTPNCFNWFPISLGLRCTFSSNTSLWASIAAST